MCPIEIFEKCKFEELTYSKKQTTITVLGILLNNNSHFCLRNSLYKIEKYNFFICTFDFCNRSPLFVPHRDLLKIKISKRIWYNVQMNMTKCTRPNILHHSNIIRIEIMNGLILLHKIYKLENFFTLKCKISLGNKKK